MHLSLRITSISGNFIFQQYEYYHMFNNYTFARYKLTHLLFINLIYYKLFILSYYNLHYYLYYLTSCINFKFFEFII